VDRPVESRPKGLEEEKTQPGNLDVTRLHERD